jgi:type II restriction/modification system DNA methylase subunit YeeA
VSLTPSQFAERWRLASLSERSGAQSHFIDLCQMLGESHPAAADAIGERFTFEKPVNRTSGGKGFADVWLRDHFAWEYKGKHKNLAAAYKQLNDYREDLLNPPLLVVCDMNCFEVHTNFGKTKKRVYKFDLHDLELNRVTADCPLPPLEVLHALYNDTDLLRPERTDAFVTQEAAKVFARMAERLEIEKRSHADAPIATREEIAHFLLRLLFCLFADNIGLLPNHIFRRLIDSDDRFIPRIFLRKLRSLFEAMAEPEGNFGEHSIKHFNGGLFDNASIIDLDKTDLGLLHEVATKYDWSHVAPAIFGTLFERSLDPARRSLIGAHYTSEADILLLVEPIIVQPIRARWEQTKASILTLLERAAATPAQASIATRARGQDYSLGSQSQKRKARPEAERLLAEFFDYISGVRVLDPACGSGNFLYVALRKLLDLWLEARDFGIYHSIPLAIQYAVDHMASPAQLFGIEVEFYAHELASVVVWIGFLQWKIDHGILIDRQPILKRLTNIERADAILRYDEQTKQPYEPSWPSADFIIGNPPFLGGKLLRRALGDTYVDHLFEVYKGRVKAESDLVVYWFEKARHQLAITSIDRVGLLATQGIRGGANRAVLERIQQTGHIFWAWSDRKWVLSGAAVHVSMVAFERSTERLGTSHLDSEMWDCLLDGQPVPFINPDLTTGSNAASALRLKENASLCFMGTTKVGAFDIDAEIARKMLSAPLNPNGRPNSDVVRPWVNALDVTRRPRNMFIIDFGTDMTEAAAALYELPFEYVKHHVRLLRSGNKRETYAKRWWIHGEARGELRRAIRPLSRYIATPSLSKHRFFVWTQQDVVPDHQVFVLSRQDDYFFGVLHSGIHELWALKMGTQLESRPRYTPDSTFDTFPFPWPPGTEPSEAEDSRVEAIADAARKLVRLRDAWLNPPNASEVDLKERTLTKLYNKRPAWLENAHQTLDRAVFAAYGLAYPLSKDEIIRHLLALNHERAAGHVRMLSSHLPPKKSPGVERLPKQRPSVKFGS